MDRLAYAGAGVLVLWMLWEARIFQRRMRSFSVELPSINLYRLIPLVITTLLGIAWMGPVTTPYFIGIGLVIWWYLRKRATRVVRKSSQGEKFVDVVGNFIVHYRRQPSVVSALEATDGGAFQDEFDKAVNMSFSGYTLGEVLDNIHLPFAPGRRFLSILVHAESAGHEAVLETLEKLREQMEETASLQSDVDVALAAAQLQLLLVLSLGLGVLLIVSQVPSIHEFFTTTVRGQIGMVVAVTFSLLGAMAVDQLSLRLKDRAVSPSLP